MIVSPLFPELQGCGAQLLFLVSKSKICEIYIYFVISYDSTVPKDYMTIFMFPRF